MDYLVTLFVIALCGTSSSLNAGSINRIQGGASANDNQFPYMISLQQLSQISNYRRGHRCGGALVTLRHAVTSATCLHNTVNGVHVLISPSEYRVFAGAAVITNDASADRRRTVERFTVHPNYNPAYRHVNDIAVITLTSAFPRNAVSVVSLSTNDASIEQGPICTSSGWGSQNQTSATSTRLMFLQKTVITPAMCQAYFTSVGAITEVSINILNTMVCALATAPSSSCMGDSGNPLVCNGNLNGILTLNGHDCLNSVDLRPEVYTRVSSFASWINTTAGPSTAGASTFQPGMAVLAVIAIVQIIKCF